MTIPKRDWREARVEEDSLIWWLLDDAGYKVLLYAEVHIHRALVLNNVVVNKKYSHFIVLTATKPNTTSTKIAINNTTTKEGPAGLFGPDLFLFSPKEKNMKHKWFDK